MTVLDEIHNRLFEAWAASYELDADDADPQLVFDLLRAIFAAVKANTARARSMGINPYRHLPNDAREVILSDGRSVWVDVDDPHSDQMFRDALEGNRHATAKPRPEAEADQPQGRADQS
jgi:hypothetical protein